MKIKLIISLTINSDFTLVNTIRKKGMQNTVMKMLIFNDNVLGFRLFHSTLHEVNEPSSEYWDQPINGIVAQNKPIMQHMTMPARELFKSIFGLLYGL
jgi:hypothetical protein